MKNIDTQHLCIQRQVNEGRLKHRKVKGEDKNERFCEHEDWVRAVKFSEGTVPTLFASDSLRTRYEIRKSRRRRG